jgi:hypothetical protein
MTGSLKDLAADQRAVLALVLTQGRTYEEIARLSGSHEAAVRQRAHAAAAQLAGGGDQEPNAETRALIVDYLLGVQTHPERVRTCYVLAGSPTDREWAMRLARSLAPLSTVPLPVIPAGQ